MQTIFNTLILMCFFFLSGCQAIKNTTEGTKDFGQSVLNAGKSVFENVNLPSLGKSSVGNLSQNDIATAFRQALTIGSDHVVSQLGRTDGFNLDPKVHIPLPSEFKTVQNVLNAAGLSFMLDDLETRLNRAAEIATPHAKELFINAISELTFDDVMSIYTGPQDSATSYFRNKMSHPLAEKMMPFVTESISQAGVISAYDNVMQRYKNIPFVPDIKADLTRHVLDQGIEGIFFYLAQQEKQIRQNPAKQTTELLKRVFGKNLP